MITTDEYKNVNEQQIKEYHRKRLLELTLKNIGEIPQLKEPDYEQSPGLFVEWRGGYING